MATTPPVESYLAEVERFWLLLRRRGLMISAAEVQLVLSWRESGLPSRVVCQALLDASLDYRRVHGDEAALPAKLNYFAPAVEESGRSYLSRGGIRFSSPPEEPEAPSSPPSDTPEVLLEPLAAIGRAEQNPKVQAAYRNAFRRLQRLSRKPVAGPGGDSNGELIEALLAIDHALVDDAVKALDPHEQKRLNQDLEAALRRERGRLGARGLEERRRALFEQLVTGRLGLWRLVPAPPRGPRSAGMGWAQPQDLWEEE